MKIIWKFLLGIIVGLIGACIVLYFPDLPFAENIFLIFLFASMALLLFMGLLQIQRFHRLNNKNLTGESEDVTETLKYKVLSNLSFFSNTANFISILSFSLSIALLKSATWIIVSVVLAITSYILFSYMRKLMKVFYTERQFPNASDPRHVQNLLEYADDGEKDVILEGFYSSHGLTNALLITGIFFAAIYSAKSGNLQIFSIITMGIILIAINGRYLLFVKNKI